MKRTVALLLLVVMVITLSACSTGPKGPEFQTVEHNGNIVILTFDYDEKTISVGSSLYNTVYGPDGEPIWEEDRKDIYRYEYDGGNITITYPNGAVWIEAPTSTGAAISWDDNYDPQRYIEGDVFAMYLNRAYMSPQIREGIVGIGFACLIMAAVGVVMFVVPEELIEMKYGWRFKNAEPTEFAVWEVRIGGIVVVIVAVVIFLIAAFA